MATEPSLTKTSGYERTSLFCAASVVVVAVAIVSAWFFLPERKPVWAATMKFNTAVGLLFASVALLALRKEKVQTTPAESKVGLASAVMTLLVGASTMLEYLFGVSFGIDEWFVLDFRNAESSLFPGRMSPIASVCFILVGSSLIMLSLQRRRFRRAIEMILLLPVLLLCFLALVGYLYDVNSFYKFGPYIRISWLTSSCLLALAAGILFARPDDGASSILTSSGLGGGMTRRLLPWAIVIPVILGWLRLAGTRRGYFGHELGAALRSVATVIVFAVIIWIYARILDRLDREQKRSERESRELAAKSERDRAQLEAVFQSVEDGITVFDMAGNVLLLNAAQARINNYPSAAAMKADLKYFASVYELKHLDGRDLPMEEWPVSKTLRGESLVNWELYARRKDTGGEWYYSFSGQPVYDNAGKQVLAVTISRDITQQKRAEQALRQAVIARDEFLSIASHELKTPLTPMKLQLQNLIRNARATSGDHLPKSQFLQVGEGIDAQIRRLTALINNLLDVSRISAGKLTLNLEPIDLAEVLEETIDRFIPEFQLVECHVKREIAGKVQLDADRIRVEQVISNLITNVMKYAPGKPVLFQLRIISPELVRLQVEDQGVGIRELDRERVFSRFERGDADDTKVSGLGLGLYISRQIMEAHGGRIFVEGGPEGGSRFILDFPR